jgi:uncharacterized protein
MRRKEKKIMDISLIEEILTKAEICRIAMVDGDEPYIVPLNFGYDDGFIYAHSAPTGRKIDILKTNNRVCFQVDYSSEVIKKDEPCKWTEKYRSVIGYGRVEIITDTEYKKEGLDIIMQKYGFQGVAKYDEKSLSRMVLLKLDIEDVVGKQSGDW